MPKPSVWMIRISLACLAFVALSGSILLVHKGSGLHPALWAMLPMHYELAIWGWLVQFVMGTAYWMFPRFLEGEPRGSETEAWIVVLLLNAGILLIISGAYSGNHSLPLGAGRLLTAASMLLFIRLMAGRVVSYRNLHNHPAVVA